jgi:hypothetical protein
MKRPPFPPEPGDEDPSGRVMRDERGNAVWQWKGDESVDERLAHAKLSLMDADGQPLEAVDYDKRRENGFNPYEGAVVERKRGPKDLRALSEWIALKKKRGEFTPR